VANWPIGHQLATNWPPNWLASGQLETVTLASWPPATALSRNGTCLTSCTRSSISNSVKNSWLTSKNKNRSIHTYFAVACMMVPLQQGDGADVPSKSNIIHLHIFDLLREE